MVRYASVLASSFLWFVGVSAVFAGKSPDAIIVTFERDISMSDCSMVPDGSKGHMEVPWNSLITCNMPRSSACDAGMALGR